MLNELMSIAKYSKHEKKDIAIAILILLNIILGYYAFTNKSECESMGTKVKFVFSPNAEDEVISFMRSAEKTIDIQVYTLTSESILREISEAEKRGVHVRVILEPRVDDSRKEKIFKTLQAIGAEVRWASMEYKLTHSKFIIVDGKKALVGSINLSESALRKNRETAIILESARVKELAELFEEDWEKAISYY